MISIYRDQNQWSSYIDFGKTYNSLFFPVCLCILSLKQTDLVEYILGLLVGLAGELDLHVVEPHQRALHHLLLPLPRLSQRLVLIL